ncbi:septum site-determining protein MinD [Methanohalophilus levihalophilus]|uniref:cell division ATPase MinD n=1 Tax=Methanohalophilus levihalophilus TaxID=1431282 RepID=UPI001AE3A3BF|nr:cell division ATPase MinD [Methanohalophilus levihalophilus]MBP2029712.1 septum site-determining protein MinD [Methanohalophilus levihalophilus]
MVSSVFVIASGKGGTGKTTLSVNIATALAGLGEKTLLIDADLGMPNVGMFMKLDEITVNFYDVLKGTAKIQDAIYEGPAGLKVLPCSLSLDSYQNSNIERLKSSIEPILDDYDHIIIDTPPGLNKNALVPFQISDKIVLVVNDDITSIVDTLKSAKVAKSYGKHIEGVIVNRINGNLESGLKAKIQKTLGTNILSEIPNDPMIAKALSLQTPVVSKYPQSEAAFTLKRTAAMLVGIDVPEYSLQPAEPVVERLGFFSRVKAMFV